MVLPKTSRGFTRNIMWFCRKSHVVLRTRPRGFLKPSGSESNKSLNGFLKPSGYENNKPSGSSLPMKNRYVVPPKRFYTGTSLSLINLITLRTLRALQTLRIPNRFARDFTSLSFINLMNFTNLINSNKLNQEIIFLSLLHQHITVA